LAVLAATIVVTAADELTRSVPDAERPEPSVRST